MKNLILRYSIVLSLGLFFFSASLNAQKSSSDYLDQGIKHMSKQQFEQALESFEQAFTLKKNDPNILAFRGQAKHQLGRLKEAIVDYNLVLELEPNYAEVFHLRGLAKYELNDKTGACEDWEKANIIGYSGVIDLIIEYCMKKNAE
ncbi:MAG: tetratricopeptide repeat protein [Bacteroidales bacterium]|nr:tetratricopeptide repeat protein [Bacteroidales bacterium]